MTCHVTTAPGTVVATPPSRLDAVSLEIIKGALTAAQEECEALLERTAMSPVIRVKNDYFVGLLDATGRLVVGTKQPMFGAILDPVLDHYSLADMSPGDLFIYNDCYGSHGSVSHSPDIVFVSPVFAGSRIMAFAFSWAHFVDIGGAEIGSTTPKARDILAEGVVIPPVRLVRDAQFNDELLRILLRNTRFPNMVLGDIRALVAAVKLAERRLIEIAGRFSAETLSDAFALLIDQTGNAVRERLAQTFPHGTYRFVDTIDDDGYGLGPFSIRLTMTSSERGLSIDTRDSDDQARGPVNFLMRDTVLKLMFGVYAIADEPSLLLNHGAINAVQEVLTRPGSIIQPEWPAPLGQRMLTVIRTLSACAGLFAQANPGRSLASSSSYVIYNVRGRNPATRAIFNKASGLGVGHGARYYGDGHDAVYFHSVKNYPVEYVEHSYPIRVRAYQINCDSGGPGRWRGGCGIIREVEILADDCQFGVRMDNVRNPPWGVNGGMCGRSGRVTINPGTPDQQAFAGLVDGIALKRGDIVRIETVGGGGWGHPFDREPQRVLADVANGFVSVQAARDDYGVVLDAAHTRVDAHATQVYRNAHRWPTKLFHRHRYYDASEWYAAFDKKEISA